MEDILDFGPVEDMMQNITLPRHLVVCSQLAFRQ